PSMTILPALVKLLTLMKLKPFKVTLDPAWRVTVATQTLWERVGMTLTVTPLTTLPRVGMVAASPVLGATLAFQLAALDQSVWDPEPAFPCQVNRPKSQLV